MKKAEIDKEYLFDWEDIAEDKYLSHITFISKGTCEMLMKDYAIEVLSDYTDFLLKEGYCDTDVYSELPTAIDRFMHPKLNK